MIDIDYGSIVFNLEKLMKDQNVSRSKLSRLTGIQMGQLKRYCEDDVQRLDINLLCRLCYILECDISDLLSYKRPDVSQQV